MKRTRQVKFGTFKCQCGCRQDFTAEYITRAPRYLDKKHRLKKLAENKRNAREAHGAELLAAYKARRKFFRDLGARPPVLEKLVKNFSEPEFMKVLRRLKDESGTVKNGG